jgi:hypothetical protein
VDLGQVRFKFIPWGLDEILQEDTSNRPRYFQISNNSLVGRLIHQDPTQARKLADQIQVLRRGVFSRASIAGELKSYIDQMEIRLASLGVSASSEIASVRKQLSLVRSAAYYFGGFSADGSGVYLADKDTDEVMHASNTEKLFNGSGSDYEVVHQQWSDSAANRWLINGFRVTSEAYGRYLHASGTLRSPAGHLVLYQTPNNTDSSADYFLDFEHDPTDPNYSDRITGYFRMYSARTGLALRYGNDDPTVVSGRQRVYQDSRTLATRIYLN